jgi:hypothetical protein
VDVLSSDEHSIGLHFYAEDGAFDLTGGHPIGETSATLLGTTTSGGLVYIEIECTNTDRIFYSGNLS